MMRVQPALAALFLEELERFADKVLALDGSSVVVINTLLVGSKAACGEMSYPYFSGNCRPWQIPDARLLAELFEHAKLDLRILVTMRSAEGILTYTTVHRGLDRPTLKQGCQLHRPPLSFPFLCFLDIASLTLLYACNIQ